VTEATFFATPAELRAWFEANHADADELLVGFHKKGTGRPSITWPEAVDEALCFGWIDSVRRSIDADSYSNRFTPRRPRSNWSAVNIKRVAELTREGRMTPPGLAAFERREEARSGVYSFERREPAKLDADQERRFRAAAEAWGWFQSRPPGYRRAALHWVMSAKRAETRERRLDTLIEDCAGGRTVKPLTPRRKL
jgi:uncharacterized protein YdeI (YjbR/CyaY-like superfamily)